MGNREIIQKKLEAIRTLLESCNEQNWAPSFAVFEERFGEPLSAQDLRHDAKKILRIYGGMGSFNDLVLYENSKVSVQKNQSLDQLRRELFQLVKGIAIS